MGEDQTGLEGNEMYEENPDLRLAEFSELICSADLGNELGKVGEKFISSMLFGISRSGSLNLTDISKALNEKIRVHATHKRLSRNLENRELSANLADRLLRLGAEEVGPDTRLIIHLHGISKKYASKIEYLGKSERLVDNGFRLCEIFASEPESETYVPLLVHVWSDQVPGYVSDAEEIQKTVLRVKAATSNRAAFYVDDQSFSYELFEPIMKDPEIKYVSLLQREEVQLLHKDKLYTVSELLEKAQTRYAKILYKLAPEGTVGESQTDVDVFFEVGALPVQLKSSERRLNFIALKGNSLLGDTFTPVLTTKTNLRSRKLLMGLVEGWLSVQDIIGAHSAMRDSFRPENFRVLTYVRLQFLLTLLEAVIRYEVSVRGNVLIGGQRYASRPHDGKLDRTYLLPKGES